MVDFPPEKRVLAFWDPDRELRAKEILYRCLEQLGVTKAALYLSGSDGSFELVTSYGFGRRDAVAAEVKTGHPMWNWIRRHRTSPAFANDVTDVRDLRTSLESAGTSRILTIPVNVGTRLVGFVDARDKGRKAAFEADDVPLARTIGTAFEDWLREIGAYGEPASPPASGAPASSPSESGPAAVQVTSIPHRTAIEEVTAVLRSLAPLPGVAATALTLTDGSSVKVLALRTAPLDHRQQKALAAHQAEALTSIIGQLPPASRWDWEEQDSGGSERSGEEIRTTTLLTGPPIWVVLSVVTRGPHAVAERILAVSRRHLETALALVDYRRAARNLARVLLEPGESSFPHLRQHAQATSELVQRIASVLHLRDDEEELLTIAAYLHDLGMRELDYARVYRMGPGEVERRLFQRHPVVGARILEGTAFPGELPVAVRHHHERWDGGGYPQRLAGRNIPRSSRIIHLAEVYDTLTSASSYKRPVGRESALEIIRSEAGTQFDPELIPALEEAVQA
ncbi:MAG: HD domain-containing phosphohydrolase [Thermoanaerobaculales bacterium]